MSFKLPRWAEQSEELWVRAVLEDRGLAEARRVYREKFGVAHDDKTIDAEIERRFWEDAGDLNRASVALRTQIVLALMLREGFGDRGKGRSKSPERAIADERAMRRYKKLRAGKVSPENAANLVSATSALSPTAILDGRVNRRHRDKSRNEPDGE